MSEPSSESPDETVESPEPDEAQESSRSEGSGDDAQDGDSPSVGAMPDPSEVDTEAIEADRAERLDPDNRPENVEVDNTPREFDSEKGMFTDSEGYDEAEATFDDDAF